MPLAASSPEISDHQLRTRVSRQGFAVELRSLVRRPHEVRNETALFIHESPSFAANIDLVRPCQERHLMVHCEVVRRAMPKHRWLRVRRRRAPSAQQGGLAGGRQGAGEAHRQGGAGAEVEDVAIILVDANADGLRPCDILVYGLPLLARIAGACLADLHEVSHLLPQTLEHRGLQDCSEPLLRQISLELGEQSLGAQRVALHVDQSSNLPQNLLLLVGQH
mmetsp:Transcript_145666/g.369661  ORF Transcript_145666/g.369661 Transcript_145666/m.369661 type:complete len:221 (+) Transcript_145666:562-1224(+)